MLTTMQTYKPHNFSTNVDVESEFEVEYVQFVLLEPTFEKSVLHTKVKNKIPYQPYYYP